MVELARAVFVADRMVQADERVPRAVLGGGEWQPIKVPTGACVCVLGRVPAWSWPERTTLASPPSTRLYFKADQAGLDAKTASR